MEDEMDIGAKSMKNIFCNLFISNNKIIKIITFKYKFLNYIKKMEKYEYLKFKHSITEEYLLLQHKFTKLYNNKTIVLMQVGSFHEAYSTNDRGYDLFKLSDLLNTVVSRKNKKILEVSEKNPNMLGFPIVATPKFIKILVDNGYHVIKIDQVTEPPNPKRAITEI